MVEILFYTQLLECELTYAQIYLVILMKDWFVLRERERDRDRDREGKKKRKKTLALFCFSLGVRGERTVTSVRITTVLFGIFDSVLITRHV